MFLFFIFKEASIMQHLRSFSHIIDYVTLKLYDIFPVSQTRHIRVIHKVCPKEETEGKFHQNWD
jgi:hypothetical protein